MQDIPAKDIESSLHDLGEDLELTEYLTDNGVGKDIKIRINTIDPTIIFDTCAQFGRIKTVKVDEAA